MTFTREQAAMLMAAENARFVEVARALSAEDWSKPTGCPAWDVRAMAGHVLGMMEFTTSVREFVHVVRTGGKVAGDRPVIDGMTEVQVAERAHLSTADLLERLADAAPRGARSRRRLPAPLRMMPMPQEVDGVRETWRLGYLFDTILTRDTWMHRVDVCRATGHELLLTADHDGLIVADVVEEWARRHGRPYRLVLQGTAGGKFGTSGEEHVLDAVEFCRILSGRGTGEGLLSRHVPF
ncbi:maleylpyruvate isomerase family mycothiol-dependent enzyme [Nonomuraea sediminis]|uniref:maleylpyruvate isomerase family mycothiol-dependent enzyme n=1 Tax=Nonomuraea sediminis TaxID=2835864 RepID=UPI001BDDAAC9|nr:maleylpyruvate isomerase family mycothiol-dependent enzyme [Nonomuraea sediminis]